MRRQNLLLKIEAGYKKMNENIQHLAGDLIYLVKWSSMHSGGVSQSVLIPQRSSYGIMRQSGYLSSEQSHSSACAPKASGGTVTFMDPMCLCSAKTPAVRCPEACASATLPTGPAENLGNHWY